MHLYRVTFKVLGNLHSTTFTALSREEAVQQFNTWKDGIEANVEFVACVEVDRGRH
jgi:hypothetical protein